MTSFKNLKIDYLSLNLQFRNIRQIKKIASFIGSIFRQFEEVEDEYCTKQEVKDSVKESDLKFQNFEE